jgi:hypothetical protein
MRSADGPEVLAEGFRRLRRAVDADLERVRQADVNFALEVHPTEIAFDIASAQRAIDAIKGPQAVRVQLRPVAPRATSTSTT